MPILSTEKELKVFAKICSKLETFIKYVIKATPTEQQLQIIKAVDSGEKRIAVKSGHGTGKSCLLSWIAIWTLISKPDAKIPITAPSYPQLMLTLMPEIKKWIAKLPNEIKDEIITTKDEIRCINNNFMAFRTARKESPESLQGFHSQNLTYILDEASGIDSEIFEVIEGALTGEENMLIMVGNPTRTSGKFYNAFNKDSSLYKTFTLNAELSPNVSEKTIQNAKKMYGEDSDAYRVRILGEFPRASSDALFSVELLDEAIEREVSKNDGAEIWGLDVAEFGDDSSVLCKRRGLFIRPLIKYSNLDTEQLASVIAMEYKASQTKPAAIYIDTIGIGAGVWANLYHKGLPVFRADVRAKSVLDGISNKRAEIYLRLKDRLSVSNLPNDDELYGELSALRYEFKDSDGKIKLENKKDTKKRLGRSPDKADSVALTFYEEYDSLDYDDIESSSSYLQMSGSIAW